MYKVLGSKFNYFCGLVKINHLFRRSNDAVMRSATRHVGDNPQLIKWIISKPGRCNTGRWGAVGEVERYYLKIPNDIVQHIMDDCFFTDVDMVEAEIKPNQNRPIDDVQMDDMKAYRQKMSRWVKASLEAVKAPEFWVMMRLVASAKAPLDHFYMLSSQNQVQQNRNQEGQSFHLLCVAKLN